MGTSARSNDVDLTALKSSRDTRFLESRDEAFVESAVRCVVMLQNDVLDHVAMLVEGFALFFRQLLFRHIFVGCSGGEGELGLIENARLLGFDLTSGLVKLCLELLDSRIVWTELLEQLRVIASLGRLGKAEGLQQPSRACTGCIAEKADFPLDEAGVGILQEAVLGLGQDTFDGRVTLGLCECVEGLSGEVVIAGIVQSHDAKLGLQTGQLVLIPLNLLFETVELRDEPARRPLACAVANLDKIFYKVVDEGVYDSSRENAVGRGADDADDLVFRLMGDADAAAHRA